MGFKGSFIIFKIEKILRKNFKNRDVALCSIIFTQGRFENVGATVKNGG
jgi:hypothetical protein